MGKILICGLTCIDIVNYVECFPEEDTNNYGLDQTITLGGNTTNTAIVLTQLNDYTETFMSLPTGNSLFNNLIARSGVNITRCIRRDFDSVSVSTVIVSEQSGTRTILHYEGDVMEPLACEFVAEFDDLNNYSWIHFEGRLSAEEVNKIMQYVCKNRSRDSLNLTLSIKLEIQITIEWARKLVRYADVVFVSKDFAVNYGWQNVHEAVDQVQKTFDAHNKLVICLWGEKGVAARPSVNASFVYVQAYKPDQVVDTLAAGDTFIAACLHFLDKGIGLTQVLQKAALLAGIKVAQKSVLDLNVESVLKD